MSSTLLPSQEKPWLKYIREPIPPESEAEHSLNWFLRTRSEGHENETALLYFNHKETFGQLEEHIRHTAHALLAQGVKKGDIVTVCAVTTPEIVYLFYAMDLIGATPNMIDPRSSTDGMREYIREVGSTFICTIDVAAYGKMREAVKGTDAQKVLVVSPDDSLHGLMKIGYRLTRKKKFDFDSNVILWRDFYKSGDADTTELSDGNYDPALPCVILHTGGTSGTPKCVMLNAKALNASAIQYALGRLSRGDRLLNVMPPFIAYGFTCGVHTPLSFGTSSNLIPVFKPEEFGSLLLKYKPQHIAGVPLHYQMLIRDKKMKNADLSFLITTGTGGDGISEGAENEVNAFLKAHHCRYPLTKGYAMTEVAATATACIFDHNKPGSSGFPLAYITVGIFDPDTNGEVGYDTEGEICFKGINMMMGYYHNPEETADVIRRHADGELWVHSGDIGVIDRDGFVFVRSRIKRVIIRHDGFKVYATTIENSVSTHPAVAACSAVAVRDRDHLQGNLPMLFYVRKDGVTLSQEELARDIRAHCERELAEYVRPVAYRELDALPYTAIGKIDYRALEALAETPDA